LSNKFQMTLAAELDSLSRFRGLIKSACKGDRGVDEAACYDLQLAADEACTNIITHGYAGMNPGSIMLTLEMLPERVIMTLTDFGYAFEPYEPPAPDAVAAMEERPTSGFGLYLIYQTMDEIDYVTTLDSNQLTLIKKLEPIGSTSTG